MIFVSARSSQPWRITAAVDGVPPITPESYVLQRADGGYSQVAVKSAWLIGVNTVELALSEPLAPKVIYLLALPGESGSPTTLLSFYGTLAQSPKPMPMGEDPAAEAYGLDIDWLSGGFTPSTDLKTVKGPACLRADTLTIAVISPGEIFHRPDDGGDLMSFVNDVGNPKEINRMHGGLKRQWLKDPRIATVDSMATSVDSEGKAILRAKLTDGVANQEFNVQTAVNG